MSRTSLRTKLAALAATGVMALGTGVLAASPAEAAATATDCQSGHACIYWGTTFGSGIRNDYWARGTYKLYDLYGRHLVVNHQTAGWKLWLCRNSDGTNCDYALWPGNELVIDMTPFNSVVVTP
ncbi:hypothetical protein [Streptomyces sp. NPDC096339]|uniref:hypothetical protein n=1 Tax=Streptomyces sp. NPDC096339 TaxID=3366086 RepID=UPI0037FB06B7